MSYFAPPAWLCPPVDECEAYWAAEREVAARQIERWHEVGAALRAQMTAELAALEAADA